MADAALVLVTLCWGLTFPLIRAATQDVDPFAFVAARFALAAAVFAPFVLARGAGRRAVRAALLPGAGAGALAWISYQAQTLGLQTIDAGRAGFITGVAVILVPLLSPLFGAGRPGPLDLAAATLATAGIWLLADPAGGGLTAGDGWVLLCAVGYAAYIHVLQRVTRRDLDPAALAFVQITAIGLIAALALPLSGAAPSRWTAPAWTGVAFCALFATVGTCWLQTRYQKDTTPERAALVFSLEPVFAAVFAFILLGETLAPAGLAGAALILLAVVAPEALRRQRAS